MESSLKHQKETIKRMSKDYFKVIKEIEKEINEVLDSPKIPNLNLKQIQRTNNFSARSSDRSSNYKKSDELISNRSAFSFFTEDIASFRSYSFKPCIDKLGRQAEQKNFAEEKNNSIKTLGTESEKVLVINKKHSESPENSKKIEETTSINFEEIKEALLILKRAHLINTKGNQELLLISEMIKDPDKSSSVELLLQCLDLENKKQKSKKAEFFRPRGKSFKPKKIERMINIPDIDPDSTSKEKFRPLEEKSFNLTLLSNENLLSPQNQDNFENSFKKFELNDVKREDIMNVSSILDDLGLMSADSSMIRESYIITSPTNETSDKKINQKNFYSFENDVPVKQSKTKKIM